jgi:hypothetical protein
MATIPVPTRECVGIDVTRNGQVVASYDAHNGYVSTDNRSHARLLERTFGSRKQISLGGGAPAHRTKVCSCGRLNFASNETCPACGADISHLEVVNVAAGS